MIHSIKKALKKIIPVGALNLYHGIWSYVVALKLGFPGKKMVVIGVTGTNGKSTTVNLLAQLLLLSGKKVAAASTANFLINGEEKFNEHKMTMPGRGFLHHFLKEALDAGCEYAVIETSSEGLRQNRHFGLYYDVAVFTNLTPEHIESHGSFENYKAAKKALFENLKRSWRKNLGFGRVPTVIIANADDAHAPYYLSASADLKNTYGLKPSSQPYFHYQAQDVEVSYQGISYRLGNEKFNWPLKGKFDVYNTLAALAVLASLDIPLPQLEQKTSAIKPTPGRLEVIQEKPFLVLVDYAPEPESLKQVFQTIDLWEISINRIIHVVGSCGGGRDVARQPVMGELSGNNADIVIVTNEDPYDDDPRQIIENVAYGSKQTGKEEGKDLWLIDDRREAIQKALSVAQENDLVLITGKGSEQRMAVADGKYIPWDDRKVAREELARR